VRGYARAPGERGRPPAGPIPEQSEREEMGMRVAIAVGAPDSSGSNWERLVDFTIEAEKLGTDVVWSAEAWGQDAVAPLAYLAARTERIRLGTAIMQISARVPSMTAMTALTMSAISHGRFILGLGASGPQVVEGLHGRPFARPVTRMRETVEIVRRAFRGEKLEYDGAHHHLPLPDGQGKALRLALPPNPDIPIYLATLSPKALELTGEVADGWLGTSFTPEHADAHLAHIRRGAERAGRRLQDIELCVGGPVGFGDDIERLVDALRPRVAFTLGAMGSPTTNFYNDAFKRGGFADDAAKVQRLWVEGRRAEAVRAVPDDLVLMTSLIGPESQVRERIRLYRDVGIGQLQLNPLGETPGEVACPSTPKASSW